MEMKLWLFHRAGLGPKNDIRGLGTEAQARAYLRHHLNAGRSDGLFVMRETGELRAIDLGAELAKLRQAETLSDAANAARTAA